MGQSKRNRKKVNAKNGSVVLEVENKHNEERDNTIILKEKIIQRQLFRITATVGKWRSALSLAENILNPNRTELFRVYQEVVLDSHLTALMETRTLSVTGQRWHIHNADGEINEDLTKSFDAEWFDFYMKGAMESIYFGYTLFQFDEIENGVVGFLDQFPRQHIDPERHKVKPEQLSTSGIPYDEDPYQNLITSVGDPINFGLLNKASPLVMFKKDSLINWADFQETLGIPPKIGRTDVRDEELRANMDLALKNFGKFFHAVLDHDDAIELLEVTQTNPWEVFQKLPEIVNSELSKLFLGQTGTTDEKSFVGSAEVHERKEQMITRADAKFMMRNVNDKLMPLLRRNGWVIPEGAFMAFDVTQHVSKKDKFEMVIKLLETHSIPVDFIQEEFNIPVEEIEIQPIPPAPETEVEDAMNAIKVFYSTVNQVVFNGIEDQELLNDDEKEQLFEDIFNGSVTPSTPSTSLYDKISARLIISIEKGFGNVLSALQRTGELFGMLKDLETNAFQFAAAKTFQQIRAYETLIFDSSGLKKNFVDFRRDVEQVFDQFNKNWLKTEFETAFAQSQNARDWVRIQSQKEDLPLLRYRTQLDERVRDEHVALEGIIRPVDDPFWKEFAPTNGYNCRCFLEQLEEGTITPLSQIPDMRELPDIDPLFKMNPGAARKVFSLSHPYFRVPKGFGDIKENNFGLIIPQL